MKLFFAGFGIVILFFVACHTTKNKGTADFTQNSKDSLQRVRCDSIFKILKTTDAGAFRPVKSVPTHFEACLLQLDSLTSPQMKEWIVCLPDGEFSANVHMSLGQYLRNNWGLWADSELSRNLYRMGILHPDDMTAIIFDSYQRKLKGEDLRLDEQLKHYQDFWRKSGMPVDSILQSMKNK
jgi:hypothetical protein